MCIRMEWKPSQYHSHKTFYPKLLRVVRLFYHNHIGSKLARNYNKT